MVEEHHLRLYRGLCEFFMVHTTGVQHAISKNCLEWIKKLHSQNFPEIQLKQNNTSKLHTSNHVKPKEPPEAGGKPRHIAILQRVVSRTKEITEAGMTGMKDKERAWKLSWSRPPSRQWGPWALWGQSRWKTLVNSLWLSKYSWKLKEDQEGLARRRHGDRFPVPEEGKPSKKKVMGKHARLPRAWKGRSPVQARLAARDATSTATKGLSSRSSLKFFSFSRILSFPRDITKFRIPN